MLNEIADTIRDEHSLTLHGSKRKFTDSFGSAWQTSGVAETSAKKSITNLSYADSLDLSKTSSNGAPSIHASPTRMISFGQWTNADEESLSSGPSDDRLAATVPSSPTAPIESNSAISSIDCSRYALTFATKTSASSTTTAMPLRQQPNRKRSASISEEDNGEDALSELASRSFLLAEQRQAELYQTSMSKTIESMLLLQPTSSTTTSHDNDNLQQSNATTTSQKTTSGTQRSTKRKRLSMKLTGEPVHDSQVLFMIERKKTIDELKKPIHFTEEEVRKRTRALELANQHLETMPMTRHTPRQRPLVYHPEFGRMVCQTKRLCRLPMDVLLNDSPAIRNGPYRELKEFVLRLELTAQQLAQSQFIGEYSSDCWSNTVRKHHATNASQKCIFKGCQRAQLHRQLCGAHYERYRTISRNLIIRKEFWH